MVAMEFKKIAGEKHIINIPSKTEGLSTPVSELPPSLLPPPLLV